MGNSFLLLSHHRAGSNFLCNLLCSNENVVNGLENQNFSSKTCAVLKYISTYLR